MNNELIYSSEQEDVLKNKQELDKMIIDLSTQMRNIEMADDIVSKIEDPMLQKQYAYEMLDLLRDYESAANDVLLRLEMYRQMEKTTNLPTNLIYFKLFKQLQQV